MSTTYEIAGAITGDLWWPRIPAYKDVSYTFARSETRDPWTHTAPDLESAVESLMQREDGDFSTAARLTGDSVVIVRRLSITGATTRTLERVFPVTMLPSIAHYVDADAFRPDPYDLEDEA